MSAIETRAIAHPPFKFVCEILCSETWAESSDKECSFSSRHVVAVAVFHLEARNDALEGKKVGCVRFYHVICPKVHRMSKCTSVRLPTDKDNHTLQRHWTSKINLDVLYKKATICHSQWRKSCRLNANKNYHRHLWHESTRRSSTSPLDSLQKHLERFVPDASIGGL